MNAQISRLISQRLKTSVSALKSTLEADLNNGFLAEHKQTYLSQLQSLTKKNRKKVKKRIKAEIDGQFFMCSAKGAVAPHIGKQNWLDEYEASLEEKLGTILKSHKIQNKITKLSQQSTEELNARWKPDAVLLQSEFDTNFESLKSILKLDHTQQEMFSTIAGTSLASMGTLVQASLTDQTVIEAYFSNFSLIHDALLDDFTIEIAEEVLAFIAEEIGTEVAEELFESLALFFTGIGAIFTAWKAVKYGLKFKRLFYDKEPLVRLQDKLSETIIQDLKQQDQNLLHCFEQELDDFYQNLYDQIVRLEAQLELNIKDSEKLLSTAEIKRLDAQI